MYGLVNNSLKEFVASNYGVETWNKVLKKSNTDIDFFLNTEPYSDELTFSLVVHAAELSQTPLDQFLNAFGEFWVLHTAEKNYGVMLKTLGDNVKDFLINLVDFHNKVILMYPKMTPPIFEVTNIEDNAMVFHYISTRSGLMEFMVGLLKGVGKRFSIEMNIEKMNSFENGKYHELFKLSW